MRPTFALLASSILGAAALMAPAAAHAYVRERTQDGTLNLIWSDPNIRMTIRTGGPAIVPANDFVPAVMRATDTWSQLALDSSIEFTVAHSEDAPSDPGFDEENTISFRTSSWDAPMYQPGQLALTSVWYKGGRIVDADIELNAHDLSQPWAILDDDPVAAALSPNVDVQAAVTHELGHVIGLDHPCYLGAPPEPPEVDNLGQPVPSCSEPTLPAEVRDATMYPSATKGSIRERTLSSDELLALHDLYPMGRAPIVEQKPSPSGGCAVAGGPSAPAGGTLVFAGLFVCAAGRRVARRRLPRRDA